MGYISFKNNYYHIESQESSKNKEKFSRKDSKRIICRMDSKTMKKYEVNPKKEKKSKENSHSFALNSLFKKLMKQGEIFLNKLPLMKILPIMKKSKNNNFLWIVFFVMQFVKK